MTLGDRIEPLRLEDFQRVDGCGTYHPETYSARGYPVDRGGALSERSRHMLYVLPSTHGKPGYAGAPCGLCKHKVRMLGGGCRPDDHAYYSSCKPEFDAHAQAQYNELAEGVRVRSADINHENLEDAKRTYVEGRGTPNLNALSQIWPDDVPLLCGTLKSWTHALDPNVDCRIQRSAYLPPEVAYRTVTIPKSNGKTRKLHVPCGPLMELQSRILERTLNRCEWPEHVAAYVPGRQLIDTARQHAGKDLVITLDLKNFFGSTTYTMVHDALVETYGFVAFGVLPFAPLGDYPEGFDAYVTRLLEGSFRDMANTPTVARDASVAVRFLTHAVTCPVDTRRPQSPRVLPQGAPTSGAFANLVGVHRLDPRIMAVTAKWGFTYSRYADDLIFSRQTSPSREDITKFIDEIVEAVFASGYRVNWDKLRVQHKHKQQRVLGLVVNDGTPRVPRKTRMLLRAQHHYATTLGNAAAAARNFPDTHDFEGKDPAEVFAARHKGQREYVRHVYPDHLRSILGITEEQWSGLA